MPRLGHVEGVAPGHTWGTGPLDEAGNARKRHEVNYLLRAYSGAALQVAMGCSHAPAYRPAPPPAASVSENRSVRGPRRGSGTPGGRRTGRRWRRPRRPAPVRAGTAITWNSCSARGARAAWSPSHARAAIRAKRSVPPTPGLAVPPRRAVWSPRPPRSAPAAPRWPSSRSCSTRACCAWRSTARSRSRPQRRPTSARRRATCRARSCSPSTTGREVARYRASAPSSRETTIPMISQITAGRP